ncbi:MAG: Gfo/Idh/MocA family oxidoreductase [bacterium]
MDIKTKIKSGGMRISRRQFLESVSAATVFHIVPSKVLGKRAPSNTLNIAGIGAGGRGSDNMDALSVAEQNIVALCDVDWERAARTFGKFPKAKRYKDFRVMLEKEKNIDAVVVSAPDHIHAAASMMAIKMGKHVYCEKPLTHTVSEARTLARAAKEHKVATQMGNHGQASEGTRRLAEYIWGGAIGQVRKVDAWTDRALGWWPQGIDRPVDTPPVPETLAWDLWLGPAPYRPYHPAYLPFVWRGWIDFGTGALGDMACHIFDPIFRALKLGHPISVEATSTRMNDETYPLASIVTYRFPALGEMPPTQLTWYDGGLKPPRPVELERERMHVSNGTIFYGDGGVMYENRIVPETKMQAFDPPPKILPRSPGHYEEWIEACKGGKPAESDFEFVAFLTEVVLLGNVALRMNRLDNETGVKLYWNPADMEFTNMPEANQYLHHVYRDGWSL